MPPLHTFIWRSWTTYPRYVTGRKHASMFTLKRAAISAAVVSALASFVLAGCGRQSHPLPSDTHVSPTHDSPATIPQTTVGFPAHFAAPFLQVSDASITDIAADRAKTGTRVYILGFIRASHDCTGVWDASGHAIGAYRAQIAAFRRERGEVIISFGGDAARELAQTCTNPVRLRAAYQQIVDTYGVTRLDFDIEGGAIDDHAATHRRNVALAALQASDPVLQIQYSLAVDPQGMESPQLDLLHDADQTGLRVAAVNVMTMDFGDGEDAFTDTLAAARSTVAQLQKVYRIGATEAWGRLGITPIAGKNDDKEFLSLSDAADLQAYTTEHGIQLLSFWELHDYDRPTGFEYSSIFNRISSR
ncbi:glycosyl hydrolase family 18 (putative chitinase) [Jatrophihabitans sp. GAS493]|uniref:glycosyl hydrolase family 18 protein n=1 Tax=Jatrophihabitans sp. GAS493 TaxID=1907575 RepID=UPI000BB832AC|nr:glycosyl hydrolase family 18 protein [Jatrophihabitans sp. GAS493]SOD75019.1 glycosyl hydrolase family 18 (putative chitinase) [Jatrophihabitans sp. GAS493]